MYEDDREFELAANFYQDCYDLYEMEGDSTMQAAKILLKVADLRTRNGGGDFIAAIKVSSFRPLLPILIKTTH